MNCFSALWGKQSCGHHTSLLKWAAKPSLARLLFSQPNHQQLLFHTRLPGLAYTQLTTRATPLMTFAMRPSRGWVGSWGERACETRFKMQTVIFRELSVSGDRGCWRASHAPRIDCLCKNKWGKGERIWWGWLFCKAALVYLFHVCVRNCWIHHFSLHIPRVFYSYICTVLTTVSHALVIQPGRAGIVIYWSAFPPWCLQ